MSEDEDTPAPSTVKRPLLVELRGDKKVQHVLHRSTFIGSAPGNSIQVSDPLSSRHHAEIRRQEDGSFRIQDQRSVHGTFVQGKSVDEGPLEDGDEVTIGVTRFVFLLDGEWDGVGQRWLDRIDCNVPIQMKVGLKVIETRSGDLSLGGMRIETDEEIETGTEVELSVQFENRRRRFNVRGRVTAGRPGEGGVGIAFVFDSAAQEAIVAAEFIALLRG